MGIEKPITTEETRQQGVNLIIVDKIRKQYRLWLTKGFPNPPTNKIETLAEMYSLSNATIHNMLKGKGAYKNV